jgi:hypothetical protein
LKTDEDDEFDRIEREIKIAASFRAFHGFPSELVSASNAGGKCVTAGETAPATQKAEYPACQ